MEIAISGAEGIMLTQYGRTKNVLQNTCGTNYKKDIACDQMSFKEFTAPFTGEPVKHGK